MSSECWSYVAADKRIIDENGLKVAENVLEDDARRILSMEFSLRLLSSALDFSPRDRMSIAKRGLAGEVESPPGFDDHLRASSGLSFEAMDGGVFVRRPGSSIRIGEEDRERLLDDYQAGLGTGGPEWGRAAVSLVLACMAAARQRKSATW